MAVYNHRPDVASLEVAVRHADRLLLIDNGSAPDVRGALREFAARFPERVSVLENEANLGLSRAYNQAIGRLRSEGIRWLYFLDHDATFGPGLFEESRRLWSDLERDGQRVGVVVPLATDDPALRDTDLGLRHRYSEVRSTITSGILTRLDVLDAVGGFDERLFVEAADLDYTSRVAQRGYRVVTLHRVLLVQDFGLSPDPKLGAVRFGDRLIRFRSLVRVGIGNSNMYRTKLFYYPEARHAAHVRTLRWIIDQKYPWKNLVRLALYLTILEHLYVEQFAQAPARRARPFAARAPDSTPAAGAGDSALLLER